MMDMDERFTAIVAPQQIGPTRITVLDNPTVAQIMAIPLGSDVIYSDDSHFMSGPWTEATQGELARVAEANECGHLHAFVCYLPPAPTPDSALSAEAIAEEVYVTHSPVMDAARRDGDEEKLERVTRRALQAAVHLAREGMVYPPF